MWSDVYAGEGQWVEAMVSTFQFLAQTVETQTGRVDHQLLRVETIKYPPIQLTKLLRIPPSLDFIEDICLCLYLQCKHHQFW